MQNPNILNSYNLILVRYGEIWLKSQKVKGRMLKVLMNNIKNMLNREAIPFTKYQLSKDSTRIFYFFKSEVLPQALRVLMRVFGVYSLSPALRTSNKLENIIERTLDVAKEILKQGDTFALKVKRSGKHEYSSHEVAVKVGQAIIDNFSDLSLKVDLSNPKKNIYIEIRDEFSYIFTKIFKSDWGGLPIESNKKIIVMDVGRLNDLLAGFLLSRRGSEIYPVLFDLKGNDEDFEKRISNWKDYIKYSPHLKFTLCKVNLFKIIEDILPSLKQKSYMCAICRLLRFDIISKLLKDSNIKPYAEIRAISDGISLNNSTICSDKMDLETIGLSNPISEYPIFTPLIGLESSECEEFLLKISPNLKFIDYCKFKPKHQEINIEELKSIYNSLNLNDLIDDCLKSVEEIEISD